MKTMRTPTSTLLVNAVILCALALLLGTVGRSWEKSLPQDWRGRQGGSYGSYQGVASFPSSNLPGLRPKLAHIALRNLTLAVFSLAVLQVLVLAMRRWVGRPSVGFMAISQAMLILGATACTELQMRIALEPVRGHEFMYPDATRHWRYNPACDDAGYVADQDGLRGLAYSGAKQPNEFRILVLGDSISAGSDLGETETYPWALRAYLQKRFPKLLIRVKNGAANGYSVYQNVTVLKLLSQTYAPDLVICEFTHANHEIVQLYESGLYRWRPFQALRSLLFRSDLYLWARREVNHRPEDVSHQYGQDVMRRTGFDAGDPGRVTAGLQYVLDYGRMHGTRIVFYIPIYYGGPQRTRGLSDNVLEFAKKNRVAYVDLASKWARVPNLALLMQDPVHANAPGSVMQARDIGDFLIEMGFLPGTVADPNVTPTGTPYPYPSPTPYPVPPGTLPMHTIPPVD